MSSPYGIQSKKLAMWLFIVADASTFGAMLFAYGFLRLANPDWTRPFAFSPTIVNGSVMTVVLLTSSLTMVAAVVAHEIGVEGGQEPHDSRAAMRAYVLRLEVPRCRRGQPDLA